MDTLSNPMNPATRRATARQVVMRAVRLPTAHRFRLGWRLARSPRVPLQARLLLLALIVYLAMPLDIIPDFIPVIGQLDDVLIAGFAVWWFLATCPPIVAMTEVERLEATSVGSVERLVPWLLMLLGGLLLLVVMTWLILG